MKLATTLEELKEILTEDVWVPSIPSWGDKKHCLVTAMETGALYDQMDRTIPGYKTVGSWNDKQTSVKAIHAMIDKAIAIRDA